MSKQAEDFRKVNAVLMDIVNTALSYLVGNDSCLKKYCLKTSAWDGIEKLEEAAASLSEPFLHPVVVCLDECAEARKKMSTISFDKDEFPLAEASLIALSEQIDRIRESDPSIAEGIDRDHLASGPLFTSLAQIASRI